MRLNLSVSQLKTQAVTLLGALLLASLPVLPPLLDGRQAMERMLPGQLLFMACLVAIT